MPPPTKNSRHPQSQQDQATHSSSVKVGEHNNRHLSPDVIGVIATYLPPYSQRHLMLVSDAWYRGVIEQDGMKPKPKYRWPRKAIAERRTAKVAITALGTDEDVKDLIATQLPANTSLSHINLMASPYISDESLTLIADGFAESEQVDDGDDGTHNNRPSLLLRSLALQEHEDIEEHAGTVTNEGLVRVANLGSLTSLTLKKMWCLRDSTLELIAGSLPHLEHLDISEGMGSRLTSNGARHLAKLQRLTSLICVAASSLMNDDGLQHVGESLNGSLTALNIQDCDQLTDVGMKAISLLGSLTNLDCEGCTKITDGGLGHLVAGPAGWSLQRLCVDRCHQITTSGCRHLLSCRRTLAELSVAQCDRISSHGWDISNMAALESLNLSYCSRLTNDSGLSNLGVGKLPLLTSLLLNRHGLMNNFSSGVTDEGLGYISNLQHLTRLEVACTAITSEGLAEHVAKKLTKLSVLNISDCQGVTDEGLKAASTMPCLTSLDISNCDGITKSGLDHLASSPMAAAQLAHLSVNNLPIIDDEVVRQLTQLSKLERLEIENTGMSDEGLRLIAAHLLEHLASLNIDYSEDVTDAGIEDLAAAIQMHYPITLTFLQFTACGGTTDAARELVGGIEDLCCMERHRLEDVDLRHYFRREAL